MYLFLSFMGYPLNEAFYCSFIEIRFGSPKTKKVLVNRKALWFII